MSEPYVGFPVGTVVRLKGGGPKMTVTKNDLWNRVVTVAWEEKGAITTSAFDPDALVKVGVYGLQKFSRDSDGKTWWAVSYGDEFEDFGAAAHACLKRNIG